MNRLQYLAYPPTSLPIRDLFVLEHIDLNDDSNVLEIGVGCGETTVRLAKVCRHVVGVDISAETLAKLAYLEDPVPGMKLV